MEHQAQKGLGMSWLTGRPETTATAGTAGTVSGVLDVADVSAAGRGATFVVTLRKRIVPSGQAKDPINEGLNEGLKEAIKSTPGIKKPRLVKAVGKSRATVERALADLVAAHVVEHRGSKKAGGYYAFESAESRAVLMDSEAINEGLNEAINEVIKEAIKSTPGIKKPRLVKAVGKSRATVERALADLVAAHVVEHRGSKKTGGYYLVEEVRR